MNNHNKLLELIFIYYPNFKAFAVACFNRLPRHQKYNWHSEQNLYVRLRDNLLGDTQTIFNKKKDEKRNKYLHIVIGKLLNINAAIVIHLANVKIDKVKKIEQLQIKIRDAERQFQECNLDDQKQQINILLEMIQHLNEIVYLK